MSSADAAQQHSQIPRLTQACQPTQLQLSPTEGFLLSRIDGVTPWKMLREIGGLSPDDVDHCLSQWIERGWIECGEKTPAQPQQPKLRSDGKIDESLIDASIDLDEATQRRILEYEAGLARDYHELLGVARDADPKDIKKAYFKLSKEFHPDRYFRKEIGGFSERLHSIFKRVLEAYEILSDPTLRAEMQKSLAAAAAADAEKAEQQRVAEAKANPGPARPTGPQKPGAAPPPPRELTKIELLRTRMRFKLPPGLLTQRQQKAREFYEASRSSENMQQWVDAAQTRKLAMAFDPFKDEYRTGFGELQAKAAETKAERLMKEAATAESPVRGPGSGNPVKEALRLYEEALLYRPHHAELNDKVANCALELGQLDKALECAETAIERCPDMPAYRVTAAKVHSAKGHRGFAVREAEQALKLDRGDDEAAKLLKRLRGASKDAAREGA